MSFQPPDEFWKAFKQENLGRKPQVFKQLFGGRCIAPPEELFRMVVEGAVEFERTAGARMRSPLKLFHGTGLLQADQLRYVPTKADGSFEGWYARLNKLGVARKLCLHMDSIQSFSPMLFDRYRQFTEGLFQQTGLPPMKIDSDMFVGDYDLTPAGVHKDVTENFAFVALGVKRMLLWPYEELLPYLRAKLDVRNLDFHLYIDDVSEIRERAIVLEGHPGDLLYWPGHYWHVAEGNGAMSVTNNMAIFLTNSPLTEPFMGKLAGAVFPQIEKDQPFTPYPPARRQELAATVPEGLKDITRNVTQTLRAMLDSGELERDTELTWLQYVSAGGFQQVPPPLENVTLDEGKAVRLAPHAGLLWRKLSNGEIAVAANGLSSCYPESRGLVETLQRLASGGAHRVGALLNEASEERRGDTVVWSRERLGELLRNLASQRAFADA